MTAAEIIVALRRRGVLLAPAGDGRLRYRPRDALTATERDDLVRHHEAIAALFNADPVGWRVAVMASQVPQTGAIPLLLARPGIGFPLGSCWSCGNPRPSDRYRCAPCVAATIDAVAATQAVAVSA